MQPIISVIVPVYKAEKHLNECIESILSQPFNDFEVILVNDGSPDNCGIICDKYARNDARVRVIHKENGGVTSARAAGVVVALGEYITFVDADDKMGVNALNKLFNAMSSDIDIVIGSYTTNGVHKTPIKSNKTMTLEEYIPKNIVKEGLHQGPWGKLYRKNLFNEKTFDIPREIVYGEDTIMNLRLSFNATGNIRIITEDVYFYRDNTSSCSNTFSYDFDYIKIWYKHLKESIPFDKQKKYMPEAIKFRFLYYDCVHKHYIYNNIWQKLDFHKELQQDIKYCNYEMKTINKISLACSNPIMCWLYLRLIQMYKRIKKLQ